MGLHLPDSDRIVITGIGTVNPIGTDVADFWDNLVAGESGCRRLDEPALADYHVRIGAPVQLNDAHKELFPTKKALRRLDPFIQLGYVAGTEAIRDSGLDIAAAPERYGALIGSGEGGLSAQLHMCERMSTPQSVTPFYVVNLIPNSASAYLALVHDLQGPSFGLNSACASANHAMGVAAGMIRQGMADAMFVGGAEMVLNQIGLIAFGNIMALSTRNDSPETASRPFERDRDGFVLGAGAGVLCIERLDHAKKRDAKIYAEISGFAFTTDAHDLVAPHPEARGTSRAIRTAIESARLNPEDVDLVNAHGTSTRLGDQLEALAINIALGEEHGTRVPVHSTKSMTGHLIGAAGAVEAIAIIMAMERGIVHKTANLFEQDPEVRLNVIAETRDDIRVNHAISNGFGFGGHNATIVFSRFGR
jgi:3-oxoacyl-[acyl-carrier-protein] synthase II